MLLESQSMAASVAQALAAEWGAGRVGVVWSDAHAPAPSASAIGKRAAIGAALGTGAALVLGVLLYATRGALFERPGRPDGTPWSGLAVGFVTAGLTSMRDELLLHGIALRVVATVRDDRVR